MSQTIEVDPNRPGSYVKISEAVAEAPPGAVVVIAPGEYAESIDATGREVTLKSKEAPAGGDNDAPKVQITGGDDWSPTIQSFGGALTLEGITVFSKESDAVRVSDGKFTATDCAFTSGFATGLRLGDRSDVAVTKCRILGSQQGLVIEDAEGLVDDCQVTNSSDDGVIIRLGATVTLRNCHVDDSGNRGIYIYQSAKPTLEGCEVSRTRSEGILVSQGGSPTLSLCKVTDATASGIRFESGTRGQVMNCQVERSADPSVDIADGAEVEVMNKKASAAGLGAVEAPKGDPQRVEELLAELDAMVGLEGVKAEVRAIIDEIQVNEWRRSAGLNIGDQSNHLIFAGAPGTGKTTVARVYGNLLAALGALPGGPLKEVSRRDLVGQYIGHTAEKTAAVFDEAKGGVVFLDEAYTLTRQAGGGGNDFGQEAVDMIVKLMEDMRSDIAVIAAGYTTEMRDFLDANPGLASRFVKTIDFPNYSADDLTLIISRMMASGDYEIGAGAEELLHRHFEAVPKDENFGNARDARKLFEKLRKVQSQRLRTLGTRPELSQLITITADDVTLATSTSD